MVQKSESRQEEHFGKLLTIATIEPSLQSLLVFEGTEKELLLSAQIWKKVLAIAYSASVNTLTLDSSTTEENLWGRFSIQQGKNEDVSQIVWQPSKIVDHGDRPLLVVIPDLTRLSLVAMRACVMLLGNDMATVQRDGVDRTWQPKFWCIAGCRGDRLGEISPHLLDRFSLRCQSPGLKVVEELSPLERFKKFEQASVSKLEDVQLSPMLQGLAEQAQEIITNQVLPMMSEQAIARIQSYFAKKLPVGMRRLLALARLSQGLASLERQTEVYWETVDQAAKLLGLRQNLPALEPSHSEREDPSPEPNPKRKETELWFDPVRDPISSQTTEVIHQQVVKPDIEKAFPSAIVEPEKEDPKDLYLEDEAPVMRELEPLKIPISSGRSPRTSFGYPIGTQPATTVDDISMLGTIFEAIKFQNYRRKLAVDQGKKYLFEIWLSDLRSYRRLPMPQYHLICAIDFTCLENREWEDALVPHLRDWAYVNRASISIIRIGAKDAKEPLRAELVRARNLLSPVVFEALEGTAGIATPLAHGLELAAQTARTVLQHGRNHVTQTRLVVLTDGRGNIPLQASLAGHLDQPVFQEGIEDALTVAHGLAQIPRLEIVFLDPQPIFYKEFPSRLAQELDAVIENVAVKPILLTDENASLDALEKLEPISLGVGWE